MNNGMSDSRKEVLGQDVRMAIDDYLGQTAVLHEGENPTTEIQQKHKYVKDYVSIYMADSPDREQVRAMVCDERHGVEPIIKCCKTLMEMKNLVDERYSSIMWELDKYREKNPSIDRFKNICRIICEAIKISEQNDDVSVFYSPCLVKAFDLLSVRPKKDKIFLGKERDNVLAACQESMNVFLRFVKNNFPRYSPYKNLLLDKSCIDSIGCLFRKDGEGYCYNRAMFETLRDWIKTLSSDLLYGEECTEAKLRSQKLADVFDWEFIEAFYIIAMPIIRRYFCDPNKIGCEIKAKLGQICGKMQEPEIIRMWNLLNDKICYKKNELNAASADSPIGLEKRRKLIEEVYLLEKDVRKLLGSLAKVGLKIEDDRIVKSDSGVMCNTDSESSERFVSDQIAHNDNKKGRRKNAYSTLRFKPPCDRTFKLSGEQTTFTINEAGNEITVCRLGTRESFKITTTKQWTLLERLLKKAQAPCIEKDKGFIGISKGELSAFKRGPAKTFKDRWIQPNKKEGSKEIASARLRGSPKSDNS